MNNPVDELMLIETTDQLEEWLKRQEISPALVRQTMGRIGLLLLSDAREALRLAEWVVLVADAVNDPSTTAFAIRAKACALTAVDDCYRAIDYFDEALRIFEALDDEVEVGRTLLNRLNPLYRLSRFREAFADAGRATAILERLGPERSLARHLSNVGMIYFRLDRFRESLAILERAETITKRVGDTRQLGALYHNRAVVLTSLNDAPEALRFYGLAKQLAVELDVSALARVCDYNICYLYFLQGKYTTALESLRKVRLVAQEAGERNQLALCDRDESEIYLHLNMYEEAVELARKSHDAFQPLGLLYDMAKALVIMGVAEHHLGHSEAALELFNQARAIYERDGNHVWISRIDCYRAMVYLKAGRFKEGLVLTQPANEVFSHAGLNTNTIYSRLLIASLNLELGNLELAQFDAQAAIDALDVTCSPWVVPQLHYLLGKIHIAEGNIGSARVAFLRAISELESLRTNIHADYLRMIFLNDKIDIYDALIRIDLQIAAPESLRECFETVERAKSRTLADLLSRGVQDVRAMAESHGAIADRIKTVREELNLCYRRIAQEQESSGTAVTELMNEARDRESQLIRLQRELPSDSTGCAALGDVTRLPLETIQAAVPKDAVLIEYYTVDNQIVAFIVSRNSFSVTKPLADCISVRNVFDLFRFQISRITLGPDYGDRFQANAVDIANRHLYRLYEKLIAPLEDSLKRVRSIIFVPHDFMHYLPFHALFDGKRHLIDRFEISVVPSATVYRACVSNQIPAEGLPLVCGITDAANPEIAREVEMISGMFEGTRVCLDADATLERLKNEAQNASFIHIASHGTFRQDNPMFSSIQLGDSELSLFDVYNLKTSAKLVTLSGCGTGMNTVIAGDELLGLARGFFYAGARSLLVSLWDVEDRATAELMSHFYRRVAAREAFASALREAMLSLKELHPHPYYWAPFVLLGDPHASLAV